MAPREKIYIIEGEKIVASEVMKKMKCSRSAALQRLQKSKTLKEVYQPLRKYWDSDGNVIEKVYKIEDREFTTSDLQKIIGGSRSNCRWRLRKSKTLEELLTKTGDYFCPNRKEILDFVNKAPKNPKTDDKMFKLAMGVI